MNKQDIIDYCLTFPGVYEDYPFDEIWTIMRHSVNRKSFAFIYERNGKLYVNFKCDPDKADFLRQIYKDVTPGYHMDKRHWNTVVVGGDILDSELHDMIQQSYDLIKPKLRKVAKIMSCENNKSMKCPCTYSCDNHGKCCACVAYHVKDGEFPACFFSKEAEKSYDRSFRALKEDRK